MWPMATFSFKHLANGLDVGFEISIQWLHGVVFTWVVFI